MHWLETDCLRAAFHARGAAIARLIYKPLDLDLLSACPDRHASCHYENTVVGPIANRIAGARFEIDGELFRLNQNEGRNCLHGGSEGLSELDWEPGEVLENSVAFSVAIEDRHMGFPGPSKFRACYALEGNRLLITLAADSPRPNYFNLAPHLYINLDGSKRIDGHRLQIRADSYLPTDGEKLPTGKQQEVKNTEFDFRAPGKITNRIIDHNFCLQGEGLREVVKLCGSGGLQLQLATDQQGLQVYTRDHAGRDYLAVEPQAWPNAVNETSFSSRVTRPGETYVSTSVLEFISAEVPQD